MTDATPLGPTLDATYVLPIRRAAEAGPPVAEMTSYLSWVAHHCRLVIVDGSGEPAFRAAHDVWAPFAEHVPPSPQHACLNGKVQGVLTGLDHARHERVIIADDDVRYDFTGLERMARLLLDHDLVVPQNYFDPLPWHARLDTARTLINRAFGHDYPGTLGVRREILERTDGYSGDVLFENLELMRTIADAGGRCVAPLDLFVRRRPPTARHFLSQRVRQAYDDFARPAHLIVSLSIVPLLTIAAGPTRRRRLALMAVTSVALAERGRQRGAGRDVFPVTASMLAPLWVLERGTCAWVALWRRQRGGCTYNGRLITKAANPSRRRRESGSGRGRIRTTRGT